MPVAAGPKNPGAMALIGVGLCIQHARERQVTFVDLGVLGMDVIDGIAQQPNSRDGL
jgi:hypothetical protein